ncbi:unnamed protein product, partial [marine sediment metagenome]
MINKLEVIDKVNLEKLEALSNKQVLKIVNEFVTLCKPSKVIVI